MRIKDRIYFQILILIISLNIVSAQNSSNLYLRYSKSDVTEHEQNLGHQEYLLGYWGGSRQKLSDSGIDFEFIYTGEVIGYTGGGVETGSDYSGNIDITATLDFDKLLGWKGAKLFTYILGNHGGAVELAPGFVQGVTNRAGAIQGISNISSYNTWKLYQIWLEQKLFNNKLAVLVGLFDLNSEFDVQESSGIFLNPSHGIGAEYSQTGENGPSIFPTTSLALRLLFTPTEKLYFNFGVFDGTPGDPENPNGTQIVFGKDDGLLLAYEMGIFENGKDLQKGFGKYSIGGWYYTKGFQDLSEVDINGEPKKNQDNFGVYFSAEKFLLNEKLDDSQGLSAFVRGGIANGNLNLLDYSWGLGFSYFGLLSGRDNDVFGLAFATAHNGRKFRDIANKFGVSLSATEMIFEVTYSFQVTPWFRVQPDFQYIINPVASLTNKYATVAGIRMEIVF